MCSVIRPALQQGADSRPRLYLQTAVPVTPSCSLTGPDQIIPLPDDMMTLSMRAVVRDFGKTRVTTLAV